MRGDPKRRSGRHTSPLRVVRRPAAAVTLILGIFVAGAALTGLALASQTGKPATPVGQPTLIPVPRGSQGPGPQATLTPVAAPTRLVIPSIGVRTGLIRLGLTPAGVLQVPSTASVAGWYTGSSRPGAVGAAVIVGHIDSLSTPGIFFHLHQLHPGSKVYVRRADGSLAVFQVTKVRSYLKSRFPSLSVYGAVPNAQLRLITCGGAFDPATGHYLSNIIVYAALIR